MDGRSTSRNLYFFCKSNKDPIFKSKSRMFRLLGLIENDVNILVSRDADGYLSNMDCFNILVFETSNNLIYNYDFYVQDEDRSKFNEDYTKLINIYIFSPINPKWIYDIKQEEPYIDYFKNNFPIQNFPAGCFATKLKIKEIFFTPLHI